MKKIAIAVLAGVVITSAAAQGQSGSKSDQERFIGAWHLAGAAGLGGDRGSNGPAGILIYTADGHMSVQLMSPSASGRSDQYSLNGYEASFGSYDVDEAKHTVTHHVQGSITRDLLVGKDLPRIYSFSPDGKLTLRSADPNEHWAVTWVHY